MGPDTGPVRLLPPTVQWPVAVRLLNRSPTYTRRWFWAYMIMILHATWEMAAAISHHPVFACVLNVPYHPRLLVLVDAGAFASYLDRRAARASDPPPSAICSPPPCRRPPPPPRPRARWARSALRRPSHGAMATPHLPLTVAVGGGDATTCSRCELSPAAAPPSR